MLSSQTIDFVGPNAGYLAEQYDRYLADPQSVAPDVRAAFDDGLMPPAGELAPDAPRSIAVRVAPNINVTKIVAGARLGRIVRELGHLDAHLDPLGGDPPSDPALLLETHGLTTDELMELPAAVIGGPLASGAANALAALSKLRQAYSGFVGYEDDHVQVAAEREWLRNAVETGRFFRDFGPTEKRDLLLRLTEVDGFEQFLHNTTPYKGQKRFSIEGSDMMVPVLDTIISCTAKSGTREVVMGMAHRGRLNVLAHVLGKPYQAILSEFPVPSAQTGEVEAKPSVAGTGALGYTGDVKYHKGYHRDYSAGESVMPITLVPNPSHLEFVNPAVVGRARAAQEQRDLPGAPVQDSKASLAILIHGDAAFPGQGVVAETLNLGQIPGYNVGGTIHIIANNQIGFTTNPRDGRSTLYASDLAKGFEIPIVHVNADEPEACIAVARMACAYHEQFGKDFLIDLIGYRRLGHNEGEEPAFTQPRMYEKIRSHPRVREIWAKKLEQAGVVSRDEADAMVKAVKDKLNAAKSAPAPVPSAANHPDANPEGSGAQAITATALSTERLEELNAAVVRVPEGFNVNSKVNAVLTGRRDALTKENSILWAHAEMLALAAILEDGTPIRMTGQDTERGTFTQRHLVLHDPTTGTRFCSLQNLPHAHAALALFNSPLSETACLGFEYGYSVHATNTLVLWEAQFGDFSNGAQVIIDQFIVSGNAKWEQSPSVVMLLPHGYEGQGPEHSSARLERFLQLCAGDNLRVANCSTPAQYFHLLRRQANLLEAQPRPLVVMTPKGLLRHPRATSSPADFTGGTFQPVLDDVRDPSRKSGVTRLLLCSGKIYIDLLYQGPEKAFADQAGYAQAEVAVARVEELNPFPESELRTLFTSYPNLREIVWVQEEPQNMGAWSFVSPRIALLLPPNVAFRYIGRPESASPAEGSDKLHKAAQGRIIEDAYANVPALAPAATPMYSNGTAGRNGTKSPKTNGVTSASPAADAPQQTLQRTEKSTHAG